MAKQAKNKVSGPKPEGRQGKNYAAHFPDLMMIDVSNNGQGKQNLDVQRTGETGTWPEIDNN